MAVVLHLLLLLPVGAASTAEYGEDGSLPALTTAQDGILPLIFCRNTDDLTAADVPWTTDGEEGAAVTLDGQSAYFRMNGTLLDQQELSIVLRMKWDETSVYDQKLLSIRGADRDARNISLSPLAKGGEIDGPLLHVQSDGTAYDLGRSGTAGQLTAGWHTVAVLWAKDDLRFYVDGEQWGEQSSAVPSPLAFDIRQLCIGKGMTTGETGYFHGMVGKVSLYSRLLTADELDGMKPAEPLPVEPLPEVQPTGSLARQTVPSEHTVTATDPLHRDIHLWVLLLPVGLLVALGVVLLWHPKEKWER